MCVRVFAWVHMYGYIRVRTIVSVRTCKCARMYVGVHASVLTWECVCVQSVCVCVHSMELACMTLRVRMYECLFLCTRMCARIVMWVQVCGCMWVCLGGCASIYECVCMQRCASVNEGRNDVCMRAHDWTSVHELCVSISVCLYLCTHMNTKQ